MATQTALNLDRLIDKKNQRWVCRLISSQDAQLLAAFFESLSVTSKETFQPHPLTAAFAEQMAYHAADPSHLRAVIVSEDKPTKFVGYAFITRLPITSVGYFGIAISDAYQGRGLSSGLMRYLFAVAQQQHLSKIYLNVVASNKVAIQSYTKQGFQRIQEPLLLSKFFTFFELWSNGTLSELWKSKSIQNEAPTSIVWMLKTL